MLCDILLQIKVFTNYSGIYFRGILHFLSNIKKKEKKRKKNRIVQYSTLCTRRIETFFKWLFLCHIYAKTTYICCIACMWHKNSHFKKVSILLVHSVVVISQNFLWNCDYSIDFKKPLYFSKNGNLKIREYHFRM